MKHAPWPQALATRWAALQPRERRGLKLAGALLGLCLLWLAMQPAWQTWRSAETQRRLLDAQLQRMQALSAQAQSLRGATQAAPARWREELEQSLASLGPAELQSTEGGLQVQLQGCSAPALARWLAELGPRWRLQVSQARLRSDANGLWQGQITLQAP